MRFDVHIMTAREAQERAIEGKTIVQFTFMISSSTGTFSNRALKLRGRL